MPRRKPETKTREGATRGRREVAAPKDCRICKDSIELDYKHSELLKKFMTERGKILPRRVSGNCAFHQRELTRAIKRARVMMIVR